MSFSNAERSQVPERTRSYLFGQERREAYESHSSLFLEKSRF